MEVHEVLRHHLPTAHFTCSSLTYSSSYPGFSNTTLQAHFPCTVSKWNTSDKRTKNLGVHFLPCPIFAWHPSQSECHCQVSNDRDAESPSVVPGGYRERRTDQRSASMCLLWDRKRKAFLLPHTRSCICVSHSTVFVNDLIQINWEELQVLKSALLISTAIATGHICLSVVHTSKLK